MQHSHGEREGKIIDQDAVNVFHLSGGIVTEVGEFFQDTGASDAFWDQPEPAVAAHSAGGRIDE